MNDKGICYLVCAGERSALNFKKNENDLLIAVDGGQRYVEEAGLKADIALGDFDSLDEKPNADRVIRLNPIKDVTDTYAAASLAVEMGYRVIRIYCALGGRLSHVFANIHTLNYLLKLGVDAQIIDDNAVVYACKNKTRVNGCKYISLIPITESASVTISGCKYSGDFTLTKCDSLGVSNEPAKNAVVTVNDGVVLVILENAVK